LQHIPLLPEPAGTRPSTPGWGLEPGPHGMSAVAFCGGSGGCWVGARAGVSPVPCPRANRSFGVGGAGFPWAAAAAGMAMATTATTARTNRPAPTPRRYHGERSHGAGPLPTERRRNRTFQAPGYDALPVLKTGWATRPVPLRGRW